MRRGATVGWLGLVAVAVASSGAVASHSGSGGGPRSFVSGSGENGFPTPAGPGSARVSVSARGEGPGAQGMVRAKGDADAGGPMEGFAVRGPVTCMRVEGNKAAIKYRFERAEGSAAVFAGGGVQIFVEDRGGGRRDATANDPPQIAGEFDLNAESCDDPRTRTYDQVEKGNFVVHDAGP